MAAPAWRKDTVRYAGDECRIRHRTGSQDCASDRMIHEGRKGGVDLTENDLVFVTNGSLVENSEWGDHHTPAKFDPIVHDGGSWHLWRNISAQDPSFGKPDKFCTKPEESQWASASITTLDNRIPAYIEKISRRPTRTGKVVTGGIVSVRDSTWLLSWTVNRQPHFKKQPDDQTVVWFYALFTDRPVIMSKSRCAIALVKRSQRNGFIILAYRSTNRWTGCGRCNHASLHDAIHHCLLLPRNGTDRPKVVPEGVKNFAFIGQFAESTRDCIFTTEYSVRTGMEAVYQLLNIDRGVPEVFGSIYDVRELIKSTVFLRDREKLSVPFFAKRYIEKTIIGRMLEEYGLI